jgi:hypothetical protein
VVQRRAVPLGASRGVLRGQPSSGVQRACSGRRAGRGQLGRWGRCGHVGVAGSRARPALGHRLHRDALHLRPLCCNACTMHHFATQLHAEQQTIHSLRASQYRNKRRHSRHAAAADDDDADDSSSSSASDTAKPRLRSSSAFSRRSLAPPDPAQLRLAGLSPEQELDVPRFPFPHASATPASAHPGTTKLQKELAAPPSRLYLANATSRGHLPGRQGEPTTLRNTHLSLLSTLLHRCLLEGDYQRAGRAWGMILRTRVAGGHPVDPRNHGRWGIGAEILLHRHPRPGPNSQPASVERQQDTPPEWHADMFSEAGFELAREYYQRFIVQYPSRRQAPHAVDERAFYPAMFSLWVLEVCEKSKRARSRHHKDPRRSRSRSMSIDSLSGQDANDTRAREEAIQAEELTRAMEIADRLDQLVVSPPFDKQASLLQLRGNIALWISDLVMGMPASDAQDDDWDPYSATAGGQNISGSTAEQRTKLTSCTRHLQQARAFLQRAETNNGMPQYQSISSIDMRLRALQKQLAVVDSSGDDDTTSFSAMDV